MTVKSAFIYHSDTLRYHFNENHPFKQKRLTLTHDLLRSVNALTDDQWIQPPKADVEQLRWVHSQSYIDIVKALSEPSPAESALLAAEKYGLHSEDTPYFQDMHEVTASIVGGSIEAARLVMSETYDHALHLGGGLHHAMHNKGAGFCVYNDASVAIQYIRRHYQARVLYIDTDVHHGDGVQNCFYTDPNVCTFSIHETGKYLFPGTGAVTERGAHEGFGYCFNLPVEPFTEDDSWLECFQELLCKVAAFFKPDVIVSLHGCDAHYFDPLSHVHCSMNIYLDMPKFIHRLAHEWCNGRWVALGGGGYDIWRVVPRAWSLLWLTMTEHSLAEKLVVDPLTPLPEEWLNKWQSNSPLVLPTTWMDNKNTWETIPRHQEITEKNRKTVDIAKVYLPS